MLFPKFSDTKAKVEVFVGSQIGQVLADEKLPTFLKCIQKVSSKFLENNKAENYEKLWIC